MFNNVMNNLDSLDLNGIKDMLSKSLDDFNNNDKSFLENLNTLLVNEIKHREITRAQMNIKISNFPFVKTINDFDFDFQPNLNKKKILDLATLRFLDEQKNIIFIGNSGVGKTHLATAIGIEAAKKRNSVYFITCSDLINNLMTAYRENKLDTRIRHYASYKLLIIDEIGYLPIDKMGSNLFYQLISKRYEKKSTIVTTNMTFDKWSDVFDSATVANAILDRLVHHSEIITIKGDSYRMKELKEQLENNN